jgi:hypothetical protein
MDLPNWTFRTRRQPAAVSGQPPELQRCPRSSENRQEGEPGSPVHLSFDHLVLVLTPSVRPLWKGIVSAAAAAWMSRSRPRVKARTWGRSAARAVVMHSCSRPALPGSGTRRAAKPRIWLARALISGQAAWMRASVSAWPPVRRVGPGEQEPCGLAGRQVRPVAVEPALVDVADQEVGAAPVAALPDLTQELLDGDAPLFRPPLAEVVAVGAGKGGLVLRDAVQPLRLAGPVVALDRVQGQAQAAGALQQARALLPQVADLLPPLPGGLGPLALLHGRALGPAGAVRQHLLPGGHAEEVPQMPPVTDLHR